MSVDGFRAANFALCVSHLMSWLVKVHEIRTDRAFYRGESRNAHRLVHGHVRKVRLTMSISTSYVHCARGELTMYSANDPEDA